MPISMYQASIVLFNRMFINLLAIMDKAEQHAKTKKFDTSVLVNSRLAPDMFPFSAQIQFASDTAKGCAARLAGIDIPSFPDTETTFAELRARIKKTQDFIQSLKPQQIDGSEERSIVMKVGGNQELKFTGLTYLQNFVLPNFYFHVSIAYAILRHNGVDIGKGDFLGRK
ncbi:MAG TPA: DUF1993 domain-containing protein [Alphaproteobacteria bacterium]|jgi:hypothetical protein|nr:DUF1993 domain-containing protein [Alphaproteobacteria bacterium]